VSGAYRVLVEPRAAKHLARLDRVIRRRVAAAIEALSADPRPAGCVALKGMPGVLRVRVGDYRIVYNVGDAERVLLIIDIDHRRDIYR